VITAVLVAVFGGALYFALQGQQQARIGQQQAADAASTVVLKGLIALDVETYFKDERVVRALAAKKLPVSVLRVGSRDMGAKVVAGANPDFFFPSGWSLPTRSSTRRARPICRPRRWRHSTHRWSSRRGNRLPGSWSPTAWPRRCRPRSTAWTWAS
jgi:hypothetical protein